MKIIGGTVVLGAVLVLASACGGGGTSYDSRDALAKAAGCPHGKVSKAPEVMTDSGVDCKGATLLWFRDGDQLDSWTQAVQTMGAGAVLVGDRWAVESSDGSSTELKTWQKKLGGKITR